MKLPDKVFGISTKEAYRNYLERAKNTGDEQPEKPRVEVPTPSNIQDANSYLILPGRRHGNYEYPDLLVSTTRTHCGEDWNHAHESLEQEDSFMLTIRQYADFLKLLKSGKAFDGKGKKADKSALDQVLDEIITVRTPWRAEWLDAKFSLKGKLKKNWHITYHDQQGNEITEPLEDCLRSDKRPGIDLSYWLDNATSQGLPPSNNPDGSLYYWHPSDGKVAWFGADSVRAGLFCGGGPSGSGSSLGVRRAKIKV